SVVDEAHLAQLRDHAVSTLSGHALLDEPALQLTCGARAKREEVQRAIVRRGELVGLAEVRGQPVVDDSADSRLRGRQCTGRNHGELLSIDVDDVPPCLAWVFGDLRDHAHIYPPELMTDHQ